MQQKTKKSRTSSLNFVLLAIVAVLAITTVVSVVVPFTNSELAYGATAVPELDSLKITYAYENGVGYLSIPDFPKYITVNGEELALQTASYRLYLFDENFLMPLENYRVSTDFLKASNLKRLAVPDLIEYGIDNPPSGGLGEGNYWLAITLEYNSNNTPTASKKVSKVINESFEYHPVFSLPEEPVKSGYYFVGWYLDEALTQPYQGEQITESMKFFAKFAPLTYSISYVVPPNTSLEEIIFYDIEYETFSLPIPERTGYDFFGWYDNSACTGEPITEIEKGSTGDKTFYAKFKIKVFTVTFYVDGEVYLEMNVEYGTSLVNFYVVNPNTMMAVAFSLTSDMATAFDFTSAIVDDLSLFADNEFVIYVGLTYNVDGNETTDLLDYNAKLTDLRVPSKEGYKFEGWYYDSEYNDAVDSNDKLTSNKTIYAKFSEIPSANSFKDKVLAFFGEVGKFFKQWWWCFAIGVGVIAVGVVVAVVVKRK